MVYVPGRAALLEDENKNTSTLPVVFTVHCLGCDLSTYRFYANAYARPYEFVWVNPEGLHNSFHAGNSAHHYGPCCGYASEQNVDDMKFFRAIVQELASQYSFVSPDYVYGTGWSNGGFMVTYGAWEGLFRAAAPISGYFVAAGNATAKKNGDLAAPPPSLFLHHSLDDPLVRATGCCSSKDPTQPKCCCRISERSPSTCTSAEQYAAQWAARQQQQHMRMPCEKGAKDVPPEPRVAYSSSSGENKVTCYTFDLGKNSSNCNGTASDAAIVANTTYCLYQNKGHFNHGGGGIGSSFPMHGDIANFFARDACLSKGGGNNEWDPGSRKCSCGPEYRGAYCLDPVSAATADYDKEELEQHETELVEGSAAVSKALTALLLLGLLGFLFYYLYRKRREHAALRKSRYTEYAFQRVPTLSAIEMSNI